MLSYCNVYVHPLYLISSYILTFFTLPSVRYHKKYSRMTKKKELDGKYIVFLNNKL